MKWKRLLKAYIRALITRRSLVIILALFVASLLAPLVFGDPSIQPLGGEKDPDPFGTP